MMKDETKKDQVKLEIYSAYDPSCMETTLVYTSESGSKYYDQELIGRGWMKVSHNGLIEQIVDVHKKFKTRIQITHTEKQTYLTYTDLFGKEWISAKIISIVVVTNRLSKEIL